MKKNYFGFAWLFMLLFVSQISFSQAALEESEFGTLIIDYLKYNKEELNLETADIEDIVVRDSYQDDAGVNYIYLNQTYQGIDIFNAISTVVVKDNKVFYYANRFMNDIANKINTNTASQSPESAIYALANHFELGMVNGLVQLEKTGNTYVYSKAGISQRDINVELVYAPTNDGLTLAWDVVVFANDNSHWYSVRIDATNNDIITINDFLLTCTFEKDHTHLDQEEEMNFYNQMISPSSVLVDGASYNVFALPAESPNHGPRQLVVNPASPVASPFGWHDENGVPGPEHTTTRGNNVFAQEDRDGQVFTPGYQPDGTSSLTFDFPLDLNQPPAGYEDVAITNLFYLNNMMHDIWYHHGFDERAGNFQANNYGNQGLQRDEVVADAQDGSGLNNATFGTPPDGQNPVMTMFLWSPVGPLNDPLEILNGTATGSYSGVQASFGNPLSTTPIATQLALATDLAADVLDACDPITNTAFLNGKIAIIRRGECEFGVKVLAAQNAGAVAVIMVNNVPDDPIIMGPGAVGASVTIPSIMVNQADGEAIIASLANNANTINATLVNNGPFQVDGDFDNGIIAHEYGHGISNRTTGGPSAANCLFNAEQMGEGWSDWFGLMITMYETDTADDARGIGTFAISQPTTGGGIRPRRYSPDFAINELTYGVTNNPSISQPHGIGSVWATALWDLTWAYIDKYGFDPDLFNGDGGNNKIMELVVQALKMQPCSPGFIDGRDALLAADTLLTGGVDQCTIWEVFAARGLGYNATQGDADIRTDQTEDFSMPPSDDPSLNNCSDLLSVDEFAIGNFNVYPNPTQTELTISTTENLGKASITLIDVNGRVVLSQESSLLGSITINTANLKTGIYILNIKSDTVNYNEKIIKN
ncbi:T9SS-dependent M36 family metallopeptidase [Winogradskyella alexanderae]|uniref:T9SS-dependent M36 family metallopeptidase n=1 Tax=Winogradskyella alexanderae TaxID=2877123 RepID=A0ABS7XM23_9FLAO|nr:T9SS-dependent M36 family metallopeptidase [Winogradskyella alexanderae]MCA0131042.1 T9SS-dependent M36 family metallopeptidase [Winogradskyella alexanderae]